MMRDFHDDLAWSKRFTTLWDNFWKQKYEGGVITRNIPLDLDKMGVDVIVTYGKGRRILIDEKVTCDIFPHYPIEVMKNAELQKEGWGWTNKGLTIAIAKHPQDVVKFSSPPVVFEINDAFQKRIMQNPNYKIIVQGTKIGEGYHTIIKRVPEEDLLIFNDDAKWNAKYVTGRKIWEW